MMKKIGHLQSHVGPDKVTSPNTWHPFIVAGWRWLWWFFSTSRVMNVPHTKCASFCDDVLLHALKCYSNPHTFVIFSDHFNDLDNLLNVLLFSRSWRTPMIIMLPYTFCSWIDLRHKSPPCQIWAGNMLFPLMAIDKCYIFSQSSSSQVISHVYHV